MIFITGPMYSGQEEYAMKRMGWSREELETKAALEVQKLAVAAEDLDALARRLAEFPVVTASEIGAGVVPVDPEQERVREAAGRLAGMLAGRADEVVRMCCGLPQILKSGTADGENGS
ncbi:MAG: bifunctional adenosylcobinamide kinase/adenosylcobinamide-phosphate guanylyltransferase [Oscillospiraceae bacterium]|nr:bifunctional adenosylcobinamide kinase/adenosylcobinamide-phosphate guanylyltransferase [Oscillospiraceae bacterium]